MVHWIGGGLKGPRWLSFYYVLHQVGGIFSSKEIVLSNKPLKFPRNWTALYFLGDSDKTNKLLSCLVVMRVSQNGPKELHSLFGSENIASSRFHQVSFACK